VTKSRPSRAPQKPTSPDPPSMAIEHTPHPLRQPTTKTSVQGMSSTRTFTGADGAVFQQRLSLPSVDTQKSRTMTTVDIIEALESYGALETPLDEIPTLRNKIHPLFQATNWYDFSSVGKSNEAWYNLGPVLRLATRLLTEEWCFDKFWLDLIRPGLERNFYELPSDSSSDCSSISDSGSEYSLDRSRSLEDKKCYDTYLALLDLLAEKTSFGFSDLEYDSAVSFTRLVTKKSSRQGNIIGKKFNITSSSKKLSSSPLPNSSYPIPAAEKALHDRVAALKGSSKLQPKLLKLQRQIESFDILIAPSMFKRLDSLSALTRPHRLRFQFMLAVALVSEVAEALAKLLALPEGHILQRTTEPIDSLSGCPGVAFQRAILGGMLVEQSFLPLFWRDGCKSEDDLPIGWAEEASAGLVIDSGAYNSGKIPGMPLKAENNSQVGPAPDMALLSSNWICQWFSDESWEMLDWGKLRFYEGQTTKGWEFWKAPSVGKKNVFKGFILFPVKSTRKY
jgi:hypothetical protein